MDEMTRRIIIEGVTEDGRTFRPSDWIERISGSLSTFGNDRRIRYSNYVQPEIHGGKRCLVVDPALRERNPTQFNFLLDFAHTNRLRVREIDREGGGDAAAPKQTPSNQNAQGEVAQGSARPSIVRA